MKTHCVQFVVLLSAILSAAGATAGDIPCDKLSEKIELYQCKQVRREFKVGIKKDSSFFCAEHKRLSPEEVCKITGFNGVREELLGDEKIQGNYIYAIVPKSIPQEQTDKFKLQCDPAIGRSAGIKATSSIGNMIPGFTVTDLPGKDNSTRNGMWQDSLGKQGKRLLGTWYSNYNPGGSKPVSQRCILYNEASNSMLIDLNGEIFPSR